MSDCKKCIHYPICDHDSATRTQCSFYEEQRPHGEWIDEGVYADYVGQHVYKCTYCNDRIIEFPTELGSYCKYCGSDNRKSGEAK